MSWLEGSRARLGLLFGRRAAESRMDDEFRFHLDMETELHRRAGLDTGEARRRALVAFGGVEKHKEALASLDKRTQRIRQRQKEAKAHEKNVRFGKK